MQAVRRLWLTVLIATNDSIYNDSHRRVTVPGLRKFALFALRFRRKHGIIARYSSKRIVHRSLECETTDNGAIFWILKGSIYQVIPNHLLLELEFDAWMRYVYMHENDCAVRVRWQNAFHLGNQPFKDSFLCICVCYYGTPIQDLKLRTFIVFHYTSRTPDIQRSYTVFQ